MIHISPSPLTHLLASLYLRYSLFLSPPFRPPPALSILFPLPDCYCLLRRVIESRIEHTARDSIASIPSIKPTQSLASRVTRHKVTTIKLRKHDARGRAIVMKFDKVMPRSSVVPAVASVKKKRTSR